MSFYFQLYTYFNILHTTHNRFLKFVLSFDQKDIFMYV